MASLKHYSALSIVSVSLGFFSSLLLSLFHVRGFLSVSRVWLSFDALSYLRMSH